MYTTSVYTANTTDTVYMPIYSTMLWSYGRGTYIKRARWASAAVALHLESFCSLFFRIYVQPYLWAVLLKAIVYILSAHWAILALALTQLSAIFMNLISFYCAEHTIKYQQPRSSALHFWLYCNGTQSVNIIKQSRRLLDSRNIECEFFVCLALWNAILSM